MKRKYHFKTLLLITVTLLLLIVVSCKKDNPSGSTTGTTLTVTNATPTTLGVYEADSSIYKLLFIAISKVGTNSSLNYGLVFDTGSGGMVIDATGLIPASLITKTGFTFTGDSTVANGITITSQSQVVTYGNDNASITKVYGNLAYADVTIGDNNGNIVVKRLPFFLYYKGVNADGTTAKAHEFDVFGVSPQYDLLFPNGAFITSPFSYFDPGTGLTKGFKMSALGTSHFSVNGTYQPVLTLGLTAADLSTSSGFTFTQLNFSAANGYLPFVSSNLTYNSKVLTGATLLFDTGTEPYSYILDKTATGTSLLPINSTVSCATTSGFNYSYTTTATENLTYVENPNTQGGSISIFGLEFFLTNSYLIDFTNHKLGVKNN
jgi:hypothetical protein